ncbi:MAG: penicillin acylase family protein [Thermoanaerobaculia bacterium]
MAEPLPRPSGPPAAAAPPRRSPRRRLRRLALALAVLIGLALLLAAAGGLWLRSRMQASLPRLEGRQALAGLAASVTVERDALGVPTIRAASRTDAVRALGFLHAQDRFFQMDLLRRQAAGELSEIFGPVALGLDKANRVHRLRDVARRVVARAAAGDRALLEAYAEGVNAGLALLEAPPFEYGVLRVDPAPWRPEDSALATLAMFLELHDPNGRGESDLGLMRDLLPAELVAFLAPGGTEWDAPLAGGPVPAPPMPGPEVFDLRRQEARPKAAGLHRPDLREIEPFALAGSNNWAVAGTRTADGRAWLANDMHLGIAVPNTWYRASIARPDGLGAPLRTTGVTLPGVPAVVVGSNGHVAWGFTNSFGDWADLIVLEVDPRRPDFYRTPRGPRRFERHAERIRVKGGDDAVLEVRSTVWGPVVGKDHRGRPRALAWTAHHPEAVDVGVMGLDSARNLDEALALAHRAGAPPQNFVAADADGRIGWTILGRIPRRVGFDGRVPTSWASGAHRWEGWLAPEEVPQIVDPPSGQLWTANARTVDGDMLAKLGNGGHDLGARARQIRDDLAALPKATPRDLLAVQLDDRALFLERWHKLLLDVLTPEAVRADPRRQELRRIVEHGWTGRASIDSAAYRLVRGYRDFLREQVLGALTARCREADEDFNPRLTRQAEGPLWRLVTQRPPHLLDPKFESWDEQLLAAVDATLDFYGEIGPRLAERTWGERNTTAIRHPLSAAVPFLGRWLDVPGRSLPGDENMPRVQGSTFGASERLVVSPGREEEGFFHMPVGESGNPLSPYYRAGHEAWEEGRPTPFLPGPARHRLELVPPG